MSISILVCCGAAALAAFPNFSCFSDAATKDAAKVLCPISTEDHSKFCSRSTSLQGAACALRGHISASCQAAKADHDSSCVHVSWRFHSTVRGPSPANGPANLGASESNNTAGGTDSGLPNESNLDLGCWSEKLVNKFIQEAYSYNYGDDDECYTELETAKVECEVTSDCHGIATQSNICSGKYRVTHGTTATLGQYQQGAQFNMHAYTLDRSNVACVTAPNPAEVFVLNNTAWNETSFGQGLKYKDTFWNDYWRNKSPWVHALGEILMHNYPASNPEHPLTINPPWSWSQEKLPSIMTLTTDEGFPNFKGPVCSRIQNARTTAHNDDGGAIGITACLLAVAKTIEVMVEVPRTRPVFDTLTDKFPPGFKLQDHWGGMKIVCQIPVVGSKEVRCFDFETGGESKCMNKKSYGPNPQRPNATVTHINLANVHGDPSSIPEGELNRDQILAIFNMSTWPTGGAFEFPSGFSLPADMVMEISKDLRGPTTTF